MSTASEAAHLEAAMEAAAASGAAEGGGGGGGMEMASMEDVELPPLGGAEPNPNPNPPAAPAAAAAAPVRYVLVLIPNANRKVVTSMCWLVLVVSFRIYMYLLIDLFCLAHRTAACHGLVLQIRIATNHPRSTS